MAPALIDVSTAAIERALAELRADGERAPALRTSVLTHVAWVPLEWERAAMSVLEGMADRYPSRAIVLHPDADADEDRLDAEVDWQCFPAQERHVCGETIRIWLRGRAALAPASVVLPLTLPDLPLFLRWRGLPPFGEQAYEQLVDVADRLIVDSSEWPEPSAGYARLLPSFERAAVSDLAWARTLPWRVALARLWPGVAGARELAVSGPASEALLLAGWLRSRLGSEIALRNEPWPELAEVAVDGRRVAAERDGRTPSDLLSDELDVFTRDPVYEAAAAAAAAL